MRYSVECHLRKIKACLRQKQTMIITHNLLPTTFNKNSITCFLYGINYKDKVWIIILEFFPNLTMTIIDIVVIVEQIIVYYVDGNII